MLRNNFGMLFVHSDIRNIIIIVFLNGIYIFITIIVSAAFMSVLLNL